MVALASGFLCPKRRRAVIRKVLQTTFIKVDRVEKIRAIEQELFDIRQARRIFPARWDYYDIYEANLKKDLEELKR